MAVEIANNVCNNTMFNNNVSAPKWLSKCFVEKHLQNYFKSNNLKIVHFTTEPATAQGENYASDLYRVNVTFSDISAESAASQEVNKWTLYISSVECDLQ